MVRASALVVALLLLAVGPVQAKITGTGTAIPNFSDGVDRVAIVTESCDASVDCARLEAALFVSLTKMQDGKPFSVVHPRLSQDAMAREGILGYEASKRFEIARSVDADALLLLRLENAQSENRVGLLGLTSKSNIKLSVHLHRLADDRVVFEGRAQGQLPVGGGSHEPALRFPFDKIFESSRVEKAFVSEVERKEAPGYQVPAELAEIREPAQDEAQTESPPGEPSYIAELKALAELRDQGVITAEDFEAKKRQLLGLDAPTPASEQPAEAATDGVADHG